MMTCLAACHHSTAGCRGGVQKTMWALLTIGTASGENMVSLGGTAYILLWMVRLSYLAIWTDLLKTPNPDSPEVRPGSRAAVLHASLLLPYGCHPLIFL